MREEVEVEVGATHLLLGMPLEVEEEAGSLDPAEEEADAAAPF